MCQIDKDELCKTNLKTCPIWLSDFLWKKIISGTKIYVDVFY